MLLQMIMEESKFGAWFEDLPNFTKAQSEISVSTILANIIRTEKGLQPISGLWTRLTRLQCGYKMIHQLAHTAGHPQLSRR
jgi:hypothetical protein